MMRLATLAFLAALLASPVAAQQSPPSPEMIEAQFLIETGQLRVALGRAKADLADLRGKLSAAEKRAEEAEAKLGDKSK